MGEYAEEELTLRDLYEVLRRHRAVLVVVPVVFAVLAGLYVFLVAKPVYRSSATIIASPLQVQARLENRIQVQQSPILTFSGLKAIAFSKDVLQEVWDSLKKNGLLPKAWSSGGDIRGLERMSRAFSIRDESPKAPTQGKQPAPLVASLIVRAPTPQIAAEAANQWAQATIRRVNAIPLRRLQASLLSLEQQIGPIEEAYQQARNRWERFTRTTTLEQDRLELDAKTKERVSLDSQLASVERDIAAVEGRIRRLRSEVAAQARVIPPNLSPDQVTLINKPFHRALTDLQKEVKKAWEGYLQAASALADFQKRSRIEEWKAELAAYTKSYASAQVRALAIDRELDKEKRLLADARERLAEYRGQLSSLAPENIVAGLSLGEAKRLLAKAMEEANRKYREAEERYQAFQRKSDLDQKKQTLAQYTKELARVQLRKESLTTELAIKKAKLATYESELAAEPKLLTLERDISGDPVALAAALKADGLKALVGLKLKNQVLNPTHLKLLANALALRSEIGGLEKEAQALRIEENRLVSQIEQYKSDVASLETERARVISVLEAARSRYEAIYRYYQNLLSSVSNTGAEKKLRDVNPDVLTYRNKVINLQSTIVGLQAEKSALLKDIKTLESRLADIKARLAVEEREKENLMLDYASKKQLYETLRTRYDQLAQIDASELVFDNPNPEYQRLRSELFNAQVEQARLFARRDALKRRINDVDARISELKARVAKAQLEADQINQSLDLAKNTYLALAKKRRDLQIELASSRDVLAQVVAPAYPVFQKVAPKRGLTIALALVLGLFLGVFWAFLRAALEPPEVEPAGGAVQSS